jgi:hypothetical protein
MGLKGYKLWVMGQLDSNVQRPAVVLLKKMPPPRCSGAGCI